MCSSSLRDETLLDDQHLFKHRKDRHVSLGAHGGRGLDLAVHGHAGDLDALLLEIRARDLLDRVDDGAHPNLAGSDGALLDMQVLFDERNRLFLSQIRHEERRFN